MVHIAGPYFAGVQRCTRCQYLLTDNRGAMVPVGQPGPGAWEEGARVEVLTGWPKFSQLTDAPPDCEPLC